MGTLFVVGTPIGNLQDMTERGIETLKSVNYILCEDTRTSSKLLNYFNIKNKLVSYHKFNESDRVSSIIKDLKKGNNIALISDAGMPCISDPGYVLIKKVRDENISVIGVGGISAFTTALSISGLNNDMFTFCGFFPRDNKDKNNLIKEIKNSSVLTYIFYESPKRIIKTLEYISDKLGNVSVSVSKELTKIHEKTYYGDINFVLEKLKNDDKTVNGEYTFVIEKEVQKKEDNLISIEALLVDEIIKNNISMKDAINIVNNKYDNLSRKEIYDASLRLKNIKF